MRIARIAGIDLRLHPTFLIVAVLVGAGAFGPPLQGAAWVALLFGSVAAHELAHSIVARRRGLVVRGITLLPIGGVSQIEDVEREGGAELAVAAAGPSTSLAVAVVAGAVSVAAGQPILPIDVVAGSFLHRLAWANAFLAGFNLVPAFPLDGGRLYRAALARRIGLERATVAAARLGRRAAVAMAIFGVLWDPWLLVIAAFVYLGGRGEEAATLLHVRLAPRRVSDVMLPTADVPILARVAPTVVGRDDPLEDAVRHLLVAGSDVARVQDEHGSIVGVLRLADAVGPTPPGAPQPSPESEATH